MARARTIKPGFFTNEILAEIEPLGRLLFAGLWTVADKAGRLEDRPKKLKAEILPYDNCNVDSLLKQLHESGFILRYESDGNKYISIPKWERHQSPHVKEQASIIPDPYKHQASTRQVSDLHHTSTGLAQCQIPLIQDLPLPDPDPDPGSTLSVTYGLVSKKSLRKPANDLDEDPQRKETLDSLVEAFHYHWPEHRKKYSTAGVVKCRQEFNQRLNDGWDSEEIKLRMTTYAYENDDIPAPWDIFKDNAQSYDRPPELPLMGAGL